MPLVGSARNARHAALTALCTAPAMWFIIAVLLVEPHTQRLLALVFTDGSDADLMYHLRRMLLLVAGLELTDGMQAVMSGVIQVRHGRAAALEMINVMRRGLQRCTYTWPAVTCHDLRAFVCLEVLLRTF